MSPSRQHIRLWLTGAVLALAGAAAARWLVPELPGDWRFAGRLIAVACTFTGLYIVALSTARRALGRDGSTAPNDEDNRPAAEAIQALGHETARRDGSG
jgi:hypothetical protein